MSSDDDGDAAAIARFQERMTDVVSRAVKAEREACARIADEYIYNVPYDEGEAVAKRIAAAIRNRK